MKIKTLTQDDYDIIIDLWKRAGLSYRPNGRDSRNEVCRQIKESNVLFIGVFENNVLIGVVVGSDDGRKGWINRLAVEPRHRRKGVAQFLINAVENALRKRGRKIICTLIEDWNENSLKLFEKCNYVLHRDIFYLSKRENEGV
ncbi:MAG: GNAT family N-acetyltransferase [Thermoplasmatales archaeon]|nr:GNAT family N-acetyltransferase [Thermoplasmatales archaeon]